MRNEITWLFIPANKSDFFTRALTCDADAIILDLEDSVHPAEKNPGRENIIDWISKINVNEAKRNIYIRINNPDRNYFADDLKMLNILTKNEVKEIGLVIPKLELPDTVRQFKKQLPGGFRHHSLIGIIETARGVHHCEAIASSGISRMAFGSLDYSLDIHCQQSKEALLYARSKIVVASRIADLPPPIDCVTPRFSSSEQLAEDALHSASLGFGGKLCIHPEQLSIVKNTFLPDSEKLAWARRVLEKSDRNYAYQIDGSMIDLPLIKLARRLLAQANGETQD
ncbi:CoA ester lyase [Salmonella enterica]|nr:CoA ester lyase [Salmonella enterica]EAX6581733.1 CoA ester lyase [Salmonella enterica]